MDFFSVTFASILSLAVQGGIDVPKPNNHKAQEANISTYVLPNIAGLWQLQLNENERDPNQPSCQEHYRFDRGNKMLTTSGKEFTYAKYLYDLNSEGLPALAIKTIYDNNAVDCSGNQINQTGDIMIAYVKQKGNLMQWCSDDKGKKCFMTLNRVLP